MEELLNSEFKNYENLNNLELKILLHKPTNNVVQTIGNLLNNLNTRHSGLLILSCFIKKASREIIEQKSVLWTTLCVKACNLKEHSSCGAKAYEVLNSILKRSIEIPELMKEFSTNLLKNIIETLSNTDSTSKEYALKMLKTCIELYSGACSQFRSQIVHFLNSFIDEKNEYIIKLSGTCTHLLQQVGGKGTQGINFKNAWKTYQLQLVGSIHEILDKLYINCSEIYDEEHVENQLQITSLELSNEPIFRSIQLFTRFKNLMTYLEIAIKEHFPVPKCVMPKIILNLLSRVLAVNCKILEKNPISDNIALSVLLPDIHLQCYKLLDAMILTLKSNLAMYYKIILNLIENSLKWTSFSKTTESCEAYNYLRSAAYHTLSLWCKIMKHGSECELIQETLIEQIVFDITPFEKEMTLEVLSGGKKYMSRKKRRKLYEAQNKTSHLVQAHSRSVDPRNPKTEFSNESNCNVCTSALDCLKCVLESSCHSLNPIFIKDIQEKILKLCIQINNDRDLNETLYSNTNCRNSLYAVTFSMIVATHELVPPPVQVIVTLLNYAQINDKSNMIRENCSSYIRNLELFIHSNKDSLQFPCDVNKIGKFSKEYRKRCISESIDEYENYSDDNETLNEENQNKDITTSKIMNDNDENETLNNENQNKETTISKTMNYSDDNETLNNENQNEETIITSKTIIVNENNIEESKKVENISLNDTENSIEINDAISLSNTDEEENDIDIIDLSEYDNSEDGKFNKSNIGINLNNDETDESNEIIDLDEEPQAKKVRKEMPNDEGDDETSDKNSDNEFDDIMSSFKNSYDSS